MVTSAQLGKMGWRRAAAETPGCSEDTGNSPLVDFGTGAHTPPGGPLSRQPLGGGEQVGSVCTT